MQTPTISIITINYNASQLTANCLRSIFKHCGVELNFEVIVVDNASEREDFETLAKFVEGLGRPNLKLVEAV